MKTNKTNKSNKKTANHQERLPINYEKNQILWAWFLPLLLIAGVVPLIVYGKSFDLTGTAQGLYWTQTQGLDFFSYWKSFWVILLTVLSAIMYFALYQSKKLPFKKEYKYYIPLATYAVFAILSTIFAIDLQTALGGFVDLYQGVFVLLSYVAITFLMINFTNTERDITLFLKAFTTLIIIEGLIGIGQYFGFDIFNTTLGNELILPSGINANLNFEFGANTIYATLFNTNFVGSFATLMIPMAIVYLSNAKTQKTKIIGIITVLLSIFTWIGCNSRAGYVGFAVAILVTIIMLRKYLIKYYKFTTSFIVLCIVGFFALNTISDGKIMSQLSSINIFAALEDIKTQNQNSDKFKYEDIQISENTVKITTNKQDLTIKLDENKLTFVDENDQTLKMYTSPEGMLMIDDPAQQTLKVHIPTDYPGFTVTPYSLGSAMDLSFYISEEGIKMIGTGGILTTPENADAFGPLVGLESLGSNRGYIWGRTIPMLSDHILLGAGPDNYILAYPQNDYAAKANAYGQVQMVVDKPHNMYLQIAINTGVISLLALLAVWGIYIIQSLKTYWSIQYDTLEKKMGLACFISTVGYLAAGIFNDHIVSVAPLSFIILGMGISLNIKIKNQQKKVDINEQQQ